MPKSFSEDLKEPPSKVARRSPPDSSTALRQREVGLHDERQTAVAAAGAAEDDSSRGVVDRKPTLDCNKKLSQIFRDLEANLRHNKGSSDEFRSRSYRRAADKIDKLGYPLDTDAAVEHFASECGSGIGAKTMQKIREFVNTGSVKKAEVIGTAERAIGIRELTSVWGVGVSTAEKWYAMGIRSVDALRHSGSIEQLNHNQKIGLKYFEEFNCKIPRQEVEEISTVVLAGVDQATRAKYGGLEHFNVVVCGSYRRGKAMCGDVDFLITHRSRQLTYTENAAILSSIVSCLSEEGVAPSFPQARLTDHLNQYRQHQEHSEESSTSCIGLDDYQQFCQYFGVFQLSPKHIHRRVDIKVWSLREYPYALVHFTGSGVFNRRMRYYAKTKLGLKVNDHGIFRSDGSCISCKTERDVFDCLNIKYM
ncbi:DNA polymerase mu, putative [Perkinsus marinus ATCC 50983]|uniref:DNA polymerase n=1 Tax=Perkinsus marinus (strain ATCC 50983 / TXsc) TaxID=423536 RepID=C5K815_PERM5|nr:DNA polymerase mu, putative [Perkinsus marinus ATCC 50983]EER19700.1 DNA polymerase mu, putative [Perkinsus marinus ATCC 50983]|eukprot:XP_002787904.1 DNA polymerase mu, putative [Perkinsus marinus ATCC 50983]